MASTMSNEVVLYGYWRSSSAYRVRLALAQKGIPFQNVAVNLLNAEHRRADHLARSPFGYVPCLVVNGEPFVESVAIVELLEELFPEPALYPRDPIGRARVRALVEMIAAGTQPVQNTSVLEHLSSDRAVRDAWARHFIARGLAAFERMMAHNAARGIEGRYAYGDTITAADLFLVPQVYNARRYGVDLAPLPRIAAADEAARSVPALEAALPERQPDAKP
jgi:maleylacetoacetate isomerase